MISFAARHCCLFTALFLCLVGRVFSAEQATAPRFTPEMEEFVRNFKPGGHDLTGQVQPLPPEETLKRLKPAEGYAVSLAASEPEIGQPIDMHFDARGRLWVVQYLQYPFPAGLTITAYDQYLRAEYKRLSPPPPNHFRGADKITILEDKDVDGKYETVKTFLDGLNMAISVAPTHDGAWVLMPPYLLFYPDRNGDDVPDSDPEVHLAGFALEDTHSLASSLHFGPDGWIYGAKGSTTTLEIQGIKQLGQSIWRYHPGRKVFEIFAEGGGNTMSFEMDKYGRAFSGTNNGGTRGVHYVQGGFYSKGWTKHGPALNPFIFGFFEHMKHEGYTQRFPQSFMLYEGGALKHLEGQIVVGMSLTNRVQSSKLFQDTSTFRTVDDIALITTEDKTFRPVDVESGPDGAIYIADWADTRLSHLNPKDTWNKGTGRIVRITSKDFVQPANIDLRKVATAEMIKLLEHPNRYFREQARRLLAARTDAIAGTLQTMLERSDDAALEALWVLNLRQELDDVRLRKALHHPNEHVRRWAVRLWGDRNSVDAPTLDQMVALAKREQAVEVRSQLASSAKRLPAGQAFPIIRALLARDEDAKDRHIPLLIWWAIESKADTGREELLTLVSDPAIWKTKIFANHIAERVGMRYTADQGPRKYYTLKQGVYSEWIIERAPEYLHRNLDMAARLLAAAPGKEEAGQLLIGMAQGLTGAPVESVPSRMREVIADLWKNTSHSAPLVTFAARLGQPGAMAEAIASMKAGKVNEADQQLYIDLFAGSGVNEALPFIADLIRRESNEAQRAKRLAALGGFTSTAAAEVLMEIYPKLTPRLKNTAQRMLSEKPIWAAVMLQKMTEGTFNPGVLSSANVETIRSHKDPRLVSMLTSYEQKHSDDPVQRAAQQLFDAGKTAYNLTCAPCHQETGDGKVGLAPALIGSRWLHSGEDALVRIILHGKENKARGFVMPPWRQFEDQQLASILTYVYREFGNNSEPITPAEVAAVRSATATREKPWTDAELDAFLKTRNSRAAAP